MDKVIAKFQIVDLQELKVAVEEIWRIAGVHASEINCDPHEIALISRTLTDGSIVYDFAIQRK